jgi:uncharacterized protein YbjQ (UPF0145 family)
MLMTTTEMVPGHLIERVLGLVEASSVFRGLLVRGDLTRQAERLGGNAVVAVRYAGGSGFSFIGTICYGTAVVTRPEVS